MFFPILFSSVEVSESPVDRQSLGLAATQFLPQKESITYPLTPQAKFVEFCRNCEKIFEKQKIRKKQPPDHFKRLFLVKLFVIIL
jgi:hypothetical protein